MAPGKLVIGNIAALRIRPPDRGGWSAAASVRAIAGVGLDGDRHASTCSPRQVLIASAQVYAALALPPMALGENVLVDGAIDALAGGQRLQLGDDVELVVMFACEPCRKLERVRTGLASAERGPAWDGAGLYD